MQGIFTENLIKSKFDTIHIYTDKNGKLLLTKIIIYDKQKQEICLNDKDNIEDPDVLFTIFKISNDYKIIEEKKFYKGLEIKNNDLKDTLVSLVTKYSYGNNNIQKSYYDSKNKLSNKEFQIIDENGRKKEVINTLHLDNDIVLNDITKYFWNSKGSGYRLEYEQFTFPRLKFIGDYKLDEYGDPILVKGKLDAEEIKKAKFIIHKKEFDEKGNVVKIFEIENGKKIIKEERKIIYNQK
ncbi:hypothetical protein RM51_08545 [Chryseobacterium taiwanense]|uniref:Uncharacterized protein n=2 Tax=Chryseobacterium taiwanense TaxID=363331 RepID=A0A0B4DGX7_9FLAO|nr:hypothetical protein RM51_08545 [Chryseobacterium taiwanense]